MKTYCVYIILCSDQSYYTGITNDINKRTWEYSAGVDPKCYTYSRRPLKLVFSEEFRNVNDALAREKQIKGWNRKKKLALIKGEYNKLVSLSKSHASTSHTSTGSV